MKLEKAWYTIKQVAEKWGCSEDDVLHQINIYNLNPSFFFENVNCYVSKAPVSFDDDTPVKNHSGLVSLWVPSGEFCNKYLSVTREWTCDLTECFFVPGPFLDTDEVSDVLIPLESKPLPIIISAVELQRFENEHSATATPEVKAPSDRPSIIDYVATHRGTMDDSELCYNLFSMGYSNNEISVTALGETYRKGNNAASQKVVRHRQKHERKLGNLTP